jgi:hypothetical protein
MKDAGQLTFNYFARNFVDRIRATASFVEVSSRGSTDLSAIEGVRGC